jgi:exosortase/archaeosortase family protein
MDIAVSRSGKKRIQKRSEPSLKAEWRSWYLRKAPVLHFCLKFGVLLLLFYALLATPYFDQLLYSYLAANAWISNAILDALHQGTKVSGLTIYSPTFAVTIERGCDAVEPTWLLCAAMISFRSLWTHRILGILAGIVFLQTLNLIRIVSLYWIGLHCPAIFNSAHMEIWPVAFLVAALFLFVGWREWTSNREPFDAPA